MSIKPKVGDVVVLMPVTVTESHPDVFYAQMPSGAILGFHPSSIDRILPRPIKVGDIVRKNEKGLIYKVEAIALDHAMLSCDGTVQLKIAEVSSLIHAGGDRG